MFPHRHLTAFALSVGLTALALTGCAGTSGDTTEGTASPQASEGAVPLTPFNQEIADSLPQEITEAGKVRFVSILFPPYSYLEENGTTLTGLNLDMVEQFKSILGVDASFETAPSIADIGTGFAADRYDVSISPMSDLPSTEETFDFADWLAEFVVFLVPEGNPGGVTSLESACGKTIATLQGGTAEKVLQSSSAECTTAGNEAITISTFADQNTAVLAVKSGRADAAFSSQVPLSYYVQQDDTLELAGTNQLNGFPEFWVGAYVPKGDPMAQVMLDSFNAMKESGAYEALLQKYGIQDNAIDTFGINLATAG